MLKCRNYRHERLAEDEEHESNVVNVETNSANIQENAEINVQESTDEQVHSIVLDMAPVSFIDSTGANTIIHVRIICTYVCYVSHSVVLPHGNVKVVSMFVTTI